MHHSIYHPQAVDSINELLNSSKNSFLISPFNYHIDLQKLIDKFEIILVFDLPPDLVVFIGDSCVESSIFDYMNPLLLNEAVQKNIVFHSRQTLEQITNFSAKCLISNTQIKQSAIYYPAGYLIDYSDLTVYRAGGGKQFIDLFTNGLSNNLIDMFPALALNLLSLQ